MPANNDTPAANLLSIPEPVLSDYRAISERNLFNVSAKMSTTKKAKPEIVHVAVADKSIDLTLLGTVAANTEGNRFAVIKTKKRQNIFHEGALADGFVIKKILRNKVIIASADGEKLLALTTDDRGGRSTDAESVTVAFSRPASERPENPNTAGGRYKIIEVSREELVAGLNNVVALVHEVGTRPYRLGRLTGFKIETVPESSILQRIGLRSHDTILAINGESIKDESQAYAFFEKIAEGERAVIKYRRRNRTRRIELNPI